MKKVQLLTIISLLLSSAISAQDYWDPYDTIHAPSLYYLDAYTGDVAWNDEYLALGVTSESGTAGIFNEMKKWVQLFEVDNSSINYFATLSSTDLLDTLNLSTKYQKFGERISMSNDFIAIAANHDNTSGIDSRHVRIYLYNVDNITPEILMEDYTVEVDVEIIQSDNEAPFYDISLGDHLLLVKTLSSVYTFKFDGTSWMASDTVSNLQQNLEFDAINSNLFAIQSTDIVKDNDNNIISWGAVDLYFNGTNTIRLTEERNLGYTNFGRKISSQFVNDNLQFLIVESDTITNIYKITDQTDLENDPISPIAVINATNLTFSTEVTYAWDSDGILHYAVDEGTTTSVLDGPTFTSSASSIPRGFLISNELFLEKETYSDSSFQSWWNEEEIEEINTNPFAKYLINLSDASNLTGGDPIVKQSSFARMGLFSEVNNTDSNAYVFNGYTDDIHVFQQTEGNWDYYTSIQGLDNIGFKINLVSDNLISGYSNNPLNKKAMLIERIDGDWKKGGQSVNFPLSGEEIKDIQFSSDHAAILIDQKVLVYQKIGTSWLDAEEIAVLTPTTNSNLRKIIMDNDVILAVDDFDSLYIWKKGDSWIDKTEDEMLDLSLISEVTSDAIYYVQNDPLKYHSKYELIKLLRNNNRPAIRLFSHISKYRPTLFQSSLEDYNSHKTVGTANNSLIFKKESVYFNRYKGFQELTANSFLNFLSMGSSASMSDNFALVAQPYSTYKGIPFQGHYSIFKKRYNQPPISNVPSNPINFIDQEEINIQLSDALPFFSDAESTIKNFNVLVNNELLHHTAAINLIDPIRNDDYGLNEFIITAYDSLEKYIEDTVIYQIIPFPKIPQITPGHVNVSYGDTISFTINRNVSDGDEVPFYKIDSLIGGVLIDSAGLEVNVGKTFLFQDSLSHRFIPDLAGRTYARFVSLANQQDTLVSEPGFLNIDSDKKSITYTTHDTIQVYGQEIENFSIHFSDLVRDDTKDDFSQLPVLQKGSQVSRGSDGFLQINIIETQGAVSQKYIASFSPQKRLSLRPAPLTVFVKDTIKDYLEPLPEFKLVYSGFLFDDGIENLPSQPIPKTDADANSNAGQYEILLEGGDGGDNYQIERLNGTLTIKKIEQLIEFETIPNPLRLNQFPFTLNASSTSEDLVYFESSNPSIVEINGQIATAKSVGSASITARQDGNINYLEAIPVVQEINVAEALGLIEYIENGLITFYPNPIERFLHLKFQLTKPAQLKIAVYSMDGRLTKYLYSNEANGLFHNAYEMKNLIPRNYFIRISVNQKQASFPIIKK